MRRSSATSKPLNFHAEPDTLETGKKISDVFLYDHGTLDTVPKYAFFNKEGYPEKRKTSLGHYMTILGGVTVVSGELKRVLEQFELGATAFYPLPLFEYDQRTRRLDELFILYVAETKDTVVSEQSMGVRSVGTSEFFRPKSDSLVALNKNACSGADLWRERRMRDDWYFSDRLHKALQDSQLLDAKPAVLTFKPCKIIG